MTLKFAALENIQASVTEAAYAEALESILIDALLEGGYPVAPDQWLNNEMRYEVPAWVFRAQEAIAGGAR